MTKKDMRPIVFKGGNTCGKVEGIRGLYKDLSGRWYVRKSIDGVDRQKTLENLNKSLTFSVLERAAASALKALEKEMASTGIARESKPQKSEIDVGQDLCKDFIERVYSLRVSHQVLLRRRREMQGFAFCKKDSDSIDQHNSLILKQKLDDCRAKTPRHELDLYKHIKAVFSIAIQMGKHRGVNPCALLPAPMQYQEKDCRFVSLQESAKVFAHLDLLSDVYGEQVVCFYYLLTLGMRATSAILFDAADLKPCADGYYYAVLNHKTRMEMPFLQIIPPHMGERLRSMGAFTLSLKDLLAKTNSLMQKILHKDLTQKHLRKGFITECMQAGFSLQETKRLTHKTEEIVDLHYNAHTQDEVDRVMRWWNAAFWQAVADADPLEDAQI